MFSRLLKTLSSREAFFGLDIGSKYVKISVFERTRSGLTLVDLCKFDVPSSVISSGEFVDFSFVIGHMKDLVSIYNFTKVHVHVTFSSRNVSARTAKFPEMDTKDLTKTLAFELQNYLPHLHAEVEKIGCDVVCRDCAYPSCTYVFDYAIASKENDNLNTLLVTLQRKQVLSLYAVLESNSFLVSSIEIAPVPLSRFLKVSDKKTVLIDIGDVYAWFIVASSNGLHYARRLNLEPLEDFTSDSYSSPIESTNSLNSLDLDLGSFNFTSSSLDLSKDDSSSEAKSEDLPPILNLEKLPPEDGSVGLSINISSLAYDIQSSLRELSNDITSDSTLYISGGVANIYNITELLREETGYTVSHLDLNLPKLGVTLSDNIETDLIYATAIGSVLRELDGHD